MVCPSFLNSPGSVAALSHLKPLVPCEEAEGGHGVAHEEPVDGLLYHVEEGLQGSDGGQAAEGWAVLNEGGSLGGREQVGISGSTPPPLPPRHRPLEAHLLFHNDDEELHLEADQVS